ncbi:MAG: hypothetical protein ABIQ88_13765 [Chitinophagaceae bacterium]
MSEQLRHKMTELEVMPPHTSWEAIAARLEDDKQYAVVATKMICFDAPPPAQIWNNIAASLDETEKITSPVVSFRKTIYRIAAAAIIIGLVIGGWMLINDNTAGIEITKNARTAITPAIENKNITGDSKNTTTTTAEQKQASISIINQAASVNAKNYIPYQPGDSHEPSSVIKYAVVNSLPAYHEAPIVIRSEPIVDKNGNVILDMDALTTHTFMAVTGPDGRSARISAKFASVIRYLNGSADDSEEYLDRVIKESDTWKKRFQEWRSKISQSSFIPSASNFLDIIEFKELIEEKK